MWTLRLLFEFMSHSESQFLTLTYSDDNLVYNQDYRPQLCKQDIQLFMKRLRKFYYPKQIRYYCAGEYGSKTKRPHYHLILFGCNPTSDIIGRLWPYGTHFIGTVTPNSIQYVAGYVLKKFVDNKRDTITPEFTLMSRRPGLGFYALESYVKLQSNSNFFADFISKNNDLPSIVLFNGKSYPLDRYFKFKLFSTLDISERKQFTKFVAKTLLRNGEALRNGYANLVDYELDIDNQKRLNREVKTNIYTSNRSL